MTDPVSPQPSRARQSLRRKISFVFLAALAGTAAATTIALYVLEGLLARRAENHAMERAGSPIAETAANPDDWRARFPEQYDSFLTPGAKQRTPYGGNVPYSHLEADPRWKLLLAGNPFGVEWTEDRGHRHALADQEEAARLAILGKPGACLNCHGSVVPAFLELARRAAPGESDPTSSLRRGFEEMCAMPYDSVRALVHHPVGCLDCHDPATARLVVTRPALVEGLRSLAASQAPVPQLPSVARWRAGDRLRPYDPNADASPQEMRSFSCAQCHVEYFFDGPGKRLTFPWGDGLGAADVERFYDAKGFRDWTHSATGAPLLKAQHPEFETWSQSRHAVADVSCADCHLPYRIVGAVKVSDHSMKSSLLDLHRACATCHRNPEAELREQVLSTQRRTAALLDRAMEANLALVSAVKAATAAGVPADRLEGARNLHRRAFWRLDYVAVENGVGFHAPEVAAERLAEAIDLARQGQAIALEARLDGRSPRATGSAPSRGRPGRSDR
jgi:nitrite reductase (cytochrome c-552)